MLLVLQVSFLDKIVMKFLNSTMSKEKVYTLTLLILTQFLLIMALMRKTFGLLVEIFTIK